MFLFVHENCYELITLVAHSMCRRLVHGYIKRWFQLSIAPFICLIFVLMSNIFVSANACPWCQWLSLNVMVVCCNCSHHFLIQGVQFLLPFCRSLFQGLLVQKYWWPITHYLLKLDNLASKVKQWYLIQSAWSSMQHRCLETSNSQK